MKYFLLLILFFCLGFTAWGQSFKQCKVYQFAGVDSAKKRVVLKQTFNKFGKVLTEEYNNYQETEANGASDASYSYFYKDTLLIERTSLEKLEGDSVNTYYYYNSKNQLIKEEQFRLHKVRKASADGKDVLFDNDFEKKRQWSKTAEINFTYDDKGRQIEYYAPTIYWDDQNRYTWKYDSIGRVVQHISYQDSKKLWVENYTYTKGGYEISFAWNNSYGTHKEFYKLDSKGREIEKIWKGQMRENGGDEIERFVTQYGSKGQILRTVVYNNDGKPEITHIYVYQQ